MIEKFLSDLESIGVSYVETIVKPSVHSDSRIHEYAFNRHFTVWLSTKKLVNVVGMIRLSDSRRVELVLENGNKRGLYIKTITRIARELETNYKNEIEMER